MFDKTLAELAAALRGREISSVELTQVLLKRIADLDPRLNSFISVAEEHALAQARAADERLAAGETGALIGVPVAQKDIFCTVSLEVGLYTNTFVASGGDDGGNGNGNGNGGPKSATSEAAVKVRVWVDDQLALPGEVVYGSRVQTLEANFQGFIADCLELDENGNPVVNEECIEPETLRLILNTMHAASFSFVIPDPGVGNHTIKCEALLTNNTA